MSAEWTHFEVLWETSTMRTNRFFDTRARMEKYAAHLAAQPFTIAVQTLEHESPYGGFVKIVDVKGDFGRPR